MTTRSLPAIASLAFGIVVSSCGGSEPTTVTTSTTSSSTSTSTTSTSSTTSTVPSSPPPMAVIIGDPNRSASGDTCIVDRACSFRGDSSTGDMLSLYRWSWGDLTETANAAVTTHTYLRTFVGGTQGSMRVATVTLTVRDRFDRESTVSKMITVFWQYP